MGNNLSLVVVPDDEDLGPAMLACTIAEREFVVALFQTGARNQTDAAQLTGRYSNRDSANAAAARWMAKPRVVAALDEYTHVQMKMGLPLATKALLDLVIDASEPAIRFKAAQELFNRNGHLIATVQRHIIEDSRDTKDIVLAAIAYARDLGDERLAYKLLGNSVRKEVIDAEFAEVATDGSDGLEDLI